MTEPTMVACPRCGSPMLTKTNRSTGDQFLGCSRFPDCRGTRPSATGHSPARAGRQARPRYRLSAGGRARTLPDYVELLVARGIGRNLSPRQGCAVQILAVVVVGFVLWAFFASGLATQASRLFAEWYAGQIHLGPSPSPSP